MDDIIDKLMAVRAVGRCGCPGERSWRVWAVGGAREGGNFESGLCSERAEVFSRDLVLVGCVLSLLCFLRARFSWPTFSPTLIVFIFPFLVVMLLSCVCVSAFLLFL